MTQMTVTEALAEIKTLGKRPAQQRFLRLAAAMHRLFYFQ